MPLVFSFVFLFLKYSHQLCPGWSQAPAPPVSASWVTGIIGIHHCAWQISVVLSHQDYGIFIVIVVIMAVPADDYNVLQLWLLDFFLFWISSMSL
jgi:hypothetical protein